ncbi:MAG: A/G-specific adenine glycosylase [Flavobacteriaceae bacterium]|nr:A/G-specific adenine glycosylase [Flavobacteriaceae bacterium]
MEAHVCFTEKLIHWYKLNYRDLPWRKNSNPYLIWVSEIILQQTQVLQGTPFYEKFVNRFPTIEKLAEASQQDVLAVWQGLGYYQRAINLHKAAQIISNTHSGIFPSIYEQLIELPGIGDYTASAILSICFQKPFGVVDGNVYRFFARYFGIDIPLGSSLAFKTFKDLSNRYLDSGSPGLYNQAIMEYGALVCTYQNPKCLSCIFQEKCYAFNQNEIHQLPVKKSKKTIRNRYLNYLVIKTPQGQYVLEKRKTNDIWPSLYQFPLIESNSELKEVHQLVSEMGSLESSITQGTIIEKWNQNPIVQLLSHQRLFITFWILKNLNKTFEKTYWIKQLSAKPFPMVLSNFVKKFF